MKSLVLVLTLFSLNLKAQSNTTTSDSNYIKLVTTAFEDLKKGDCKPCLEKYEAAFKVSQRSVLSRLRAALCAFDCKNDEAFQLHLNFALEKDFGLVEQILADGYPEFDKYRETDFYKMANDILNKKLSLANYDLALRKELETIQKDDQALRGQLNDPMSEVEKKQKWVKINELDSLNLIKIEKIFEKHGYPSKSKVGTRFSGTAFLVVQHSNLATMKKYYKLFEDAVNKGDLEKPSFALFVDRYRMWSDEKQLYGSQVRDYLGNGKWAFHPIEDEENVNKRRAEMGLGTLEEYAKHFNIDYKLPVKKE